MLKIERIFNNENNIKLSDIVNSLIVEHIDKYLIEYYNSDKVNFATCQINIQGDVA